MIVYVKQINFSCPIRYIYIYNELDNWSLFVSRKLSFTTWTIIYMLETQHK